MVLASAYAATAGLGAGVLLAAGGFAGDGVGAGGGGQEGERAPVVGALRIGAPAEEGRPEAKPSATKPRAPGGEAAGDGTEGRPGAKPGDESRKGG